MSYIGKNPKVDSVKLEGSSTAASGTDEGQLYYNTGGGSISKGLKVFKNGQFVAIDKQLGDADTMQLLKAADIPAVDFSLSLTSTTVGGNNAVPFESSTGDFDGTASFSNSSTGNALLTDESADLVFHYQTQATNNADNDFFGIPLTVPRAFRGGNLVLEFKYRTLIASGTMDDGYFNIAVQDRSAMISQTQASTISAGAISAGSNVLLTGKTFANPVTGTTLTVAVGDRVYVESGTGTAGSQDNDIVEAYITSVSSTDNNVTLSKDIVAVQSGKFVTGWLTSPDVGGQLKAAASDTNKDGTTKKIQFKTEADTQQISLWFFVKGTSTVKHDLFFDNILLSGNKFLQASAKTKSADYNIAQLTSAMSDIQGGVAWNLSTATISEGAGFSDIIQVSTGGTGTGIYTKFEALVDCVVDASCTLVDGGTSMAASVVKGAVGNQPLVMGSGPVGNSHKLGASCAIVLKKGEEFHFETRTSNEGLDPGDPGAQYSGTTATYAQIVATPEVADVIILESQDEIFTDWIAYTPTITGGANGANTQWRYRLVGSEMEIQALYYHTSAGTADWSFSLPSGYAISSTAGPTSTDHLLAGFYIIDQSNAGNHGGCLLYLPGGTAIFRGNDQLYNTSGTFNPLAPVAGTAGAGGTNVFWSLNAKVPIQGRNTNFNPLLSLPLVDFGTFQNSFTCICEYDSTGVTTLTIPAGTPSNVFTGTSTKVGTGRWSIGLGSRFTQTPAISVTQISSHNQRAVFGDASSSTSVGWQNSLLTSGAYEDQTGTVSITVTAQGADFIDPPQPTASVIKPAVAVLKAVFSSTTVNPVSSDSTGFVNLPLNTFEGETWFVTPGTGTIGVGGTNTDFTLEAGTYKIVSSNPQYNCGNSANRLVGGSTFGDTFLLGQTGYSDNNYNTQVFTQMSGVLTLTEATSFRVQSNSTVTSTNAFGVANTELNSVYLQLTIEKLK